MISFAIDTDLGHIISGSGQGQRGLFLIVDFQTGLINSISHWIRAWDQNTPRCFITTWLTFIWQYELLTTNNIFSQKIKNTCKTYTSKWTCFSLLLSLPSTDLTTISTLSLGKSELVAQLNSVLHLLPGALIGRKFCFGKKSSSGVLVSILAQLLSSVTFHPSWQK